MLPVTTPETTVYVPPDPQLNVAAWAGLIPTKCITNKSGASTGILQGFMAGG